MSDPQNPHRDFKGLWIPKEIWLDTSLSLFEKTLFAEIHSLDGERGCFADNKYLMKFFNVSERKLQEGLKKLKSYGYISVKSFDGRQRILRSHIENIYEKFRTPDLQDEKTIYEKFRTPTPQNSASSPYIDIKLEKKKNNIKRKSDHDSPSAQTTTRQASRTAMASKITLNEKGRFEGITPEDIEEWKKTFTALNVQKELDRCRLWAKNNSRKNYRKSILTWFMNVEKSHTEPFKASTIDEKEVSSKDIEVNRKKAQEWELKAQKQGLHGPYAIQATPTKICFVLPHNQGYEVEYYKTKEEFEKLCQKGLKKMKLLL